MIFGRAAKEQTSSSRCKFFGDYDQPGIPRTRFTGTDQGTKHEIVPKVKM